ncbi:hypothetical protein QJS10_CPA01g00427 [Acorus calamus]|uniref:Uncharacterized protein n=1 Tax=Acorus calamus TaxID=4465 RepID=A0AAV9FFU4_ACOCL|nr:hypothetical protein QJS10_CPA01g00427 [Acorus calamus]
MDNRDKSSSKRQTKFSSSLHKLSIPSALKVGDLDSSEKPKRARVRSSSQLLRACTSNGDNEKGEDELNLPLLTSSTSLSSRKRVRLSGKTLEDCNAVDPASVPRRLRSDEEEVAETLFALSMMDPDSKKHSTDQKILEKPEIKSNSTSISEAASKGEHTDVPLLPTGIEAAQPSPQQEELLRGTTKAENPIEPPSMQSLVPVNDERSRPFGGTTQIELLKPNQVDKNNKDNRNSSNLTISASHESLTSNRSSQIKRVEACQEQEKKLEIRPSEVVNYVKDQKARLIMEQTHTEDVAPSLCPGVATNGYQHQKWSTKSSLLSDSINCSMKLWPTENCFLTRKLLTMPTSRKRKWKRCATHVHISHLIQSCQSMDKKYQLPVPTNHVKCEDRPKATDALTNGTARLLDRDPQEDRIANTQDTRLSHDQQAPTTSGIFFQDGKSCNFQSSVSDDNNALESMGEPSVPFLHPFISNNHFTHFSTSNKRDSMVHPEQTTPNTAQQMQLPQYLHATSYESNVGCGGGLLKQHQEQQMWQAQLAQFGPPRGLKLQNYVQSQLIVSSGGFNYSLNPQQQLSYVPLPDLSGRRHHNNYHHHIFLVREAVVAV